MIDTIITPALIVDGIVGSILTGVFAAKSFAGLGLNGVITLEQVGIQTLAVVVVALWSAG